MTTAHYAKTLHLVKMMESFLKNHHRWGKSGQLSWQDWIDLIDRNKDILDLTLLQHWASVKKAEELRAYLSYRLANSQKVR